MAASGQLRRAGAHRLATAGGCISVCRPLEAPTSTSTVCIRTWPTLLPNLQITWPDGFSQIASYELLDSLPRLSAEEAAARQQQRAAAAAAAGSSGGLSAAQQILQNARSASPPS